MKSLNSCRIGSSLIPVFFAAILSFAAEDPQIEARVREIEHNLIAPCCWTQPVSQHDSEISRKIRKEVREMVAAGMSREEILNHYVAQYGERILAMPRPRGFNALVYVLPWIALFLGIMLLVHLLKKLRSPEPVAGAPESIDKRYAAVIEKEIRELEK